MNVNPTLANFSDISFRSAVAMYTLALLLTLGAYLAASGSRRQEKFFGMGQMVVWLGVIFQGISVVLRGLSAHRFPWGNLYEYINVTTFVAMVVATILLSRAQLRILWPWILAPVTLLLFYGGTKLYAASAPVVPALRSFWLPIHVSVVAIGAAFGLVAGMASLLYILKYYFPNSKVTKPLPSLDLLDTIALRCTTVTLPLFGLGIVLGAIWAEAAWGRPWGWDAKETVSFVTWILYAAYLHARLTPRFKNHVAALINVLAFATMVFNLFFINLFVNSLHSYAGLN